MTVKIVKSWTMVHRRHVGQVGEVVERINSGNGSQVDRDMVRVRLQSGINVILEPDDVIQVGGSE